MPDELLQFIELAKRMGWYEGCGQTAFEFVDSQVTRLMDLHDLVKKKALECSTCARNK